MWLVIPAGDVWQRGYGEDPYTNGVFGAASVKGYQGDDLSAETVWQLV